jgi:MoxR-like ATPase
VLDYPKKEEEGMIIRNNVSLAPFPKTKQVVDPEQIVRARQIVREVYMDEKIEKYIVDIVYATRDPEDYDLKSLKELISFGASPRASISMALAAKAFAFLNHRGFVIPEDVRAVAPDVMRHRIGLTYEAEAENVSVEDVIQQVLNTVEVP